MLQRTLGSGWGVLLPGVIIVGLAFIGLSAYALKLLIVSGLLLSALMLYHKQLRILYCCHRVWRLLAA